MNQLALELTPANQRDRILAVLKARPNQRISALDFKLGTFGFTCDAVSQRMGDLRRAGHPIESTGKGRGVASYWWAES